MTVNILQDHFRCLAHILNLGVQDMLSFLRFVAPDEEYSDESSDDQEDSNLEDDTNISVPNDLTDLLQKIRGMCKKIKYSAAIAGELEDFCKPFKLKYVKPFLDCRTRWNSSLKMLEVIQRLKPAIKLLCDNNKEMKSFKLLDIEWDALDLVISYLQIFKETSDLLSAQRYPTLSIAVLAINILLDYIEKAVFALDEKIDRSRLDEILIVAFQKGRDKLLKHYRLCNWLYSASLILDPRHKVKKFSKTEWGRDMEKESLACFEKIFDEYCAKYSTDVTESENNKRDPKNKNCLHFGAIFDSEEEEETELQKYLHEKCAPEKTDILEWWRDHESSYPVLAKMARDKLAIMATSVPVERLFSNAGLIDVPKRGSLKDETFKSLLLINMWSKSEVAKEICGFKNDV